MLIHHVRRLFAWIPVWVRRASAFVIGLALFLGALTELRDFGRQLYTTLLPQTVDASAVFVTGDRVLASSYLDMVAALGFSTTVISPSDLASILDLEPGLLIVGGPGTADVDSIVIPSAVIDHLRSSAKLLGIGAFGSSFLEAVYPYTSIGAKSSIRKVPSSVVLPRSAAESLGEDLPVAAVRLLQPGIAPNMEDVAIHDRGSLAMLGVIGIAQIPAGVCEPAYWPVAIQENHAIWGLSAHAGVLTENGRSLFKALVRQLKTSPLQPFKPMKVITPPGQIESTLGCQFKLEEFVLDVNAPGSLQASVSASQPVALIVNGPRLPGSLARRDRQFAREDGTAVTVKVDVGSDSLARGRYWTVEIQFFGDIHPEDRVYYRLTLDYPTRQTHVWRWLALALFGLVLIGMAARYSVASFLRRARLFQRCRSALSGAAERPAVRPHRGGIRVKVVSTGDVDLGILRELGEDLAPEIELEVDDRQIFMKSLEPPSWVTFLAEADWWMKALAACAALYIAEIVKEAAKDTWKNRAKAISGLAAAGNQIRRLAASMASLRARLAPRTRIEVGIPFPEEHWPARLQLSGSDPDEIALQLALFVHHLPALHSFISTKGLDSDRVAAGMSLKLLTDGSLEVSWQDAQSLSLQQHVLKLGGAA